MLHDDLVALERRCRSEAPALLADVRKILERYGASPSVNTLLESAVTLATTEQWTLGGEEPTAEGPAVAGGLWLRYDDLGRIGAGGMGEVFRVRDRELNRVVAMKVLQSTLLSKPASLARFVEEAQATSQLQHPHIVPVYDIGTLTDGRVYFTMKEVRGSTYDKAIAEVHAASGERWDRSESGWTLRRLVGTLHQVSQAVAYAHERGVVHRDLKPQNIMVGDFREVQVMDWGLAKVLARPGRPDFGDDAGAPDIVVTDRSEDDAAATRTGTVAGSPAYMAPEQARGDVDRIDVRTDVYALGAILYEVLSGRRPFVGDSRSAWRQVLQGPPAPLTQVGMVAPAAFTSEPATEGQAATTEGRRLPRELVDACDRAMARDPADRFQSAAAFAADLEAWLDGSKRREQALAVVDRAERIVPHAQAMRERAELTLEAEAALAQVPIWAPGADKAAAWALEDEASDLRRRASLKALEREQLLVAALTHSPELPEAHAALAEDLRARHAAAEAARDSQEVAKATVLLRRHAEALPEHHEVRQRCAAYLSGDGALTLVTDPPGAELWLHTYQRRARRLVAVPVRSLGLTPLFEVGLPMGSYLCVLRHPDHADVPYPVHIGRGGHWHGVRPGDTDPHPVWLPRPADLDAEERYVPAGWFRAGSTSAYGAIQPTRLWCDAFAMRRFPVTNREYLTFLDDLVSQGREHEALLWAPQERGGSAGERGPVIYGRDPSGRFVLRPDADGDVWQPDWPVMMVDWHAAVAYAGWEAERSGRSWRLAWDMEWEKAACGVDGRIHPWGDSVDPSFCCCRASHPGRALPQVVDSFPLDVSPYGVRGLGGNVRDWCLDTWTKLDALSANRIVRPIERDGGRSARSLRVHRGGNWDGPLSFARSARRNDSDAGDRDAHLGLRLARTVEVHGLVSTRHPRGRHHST